MSKMNWKGLAAVFTLSVVLTGRGRSGDPAAGHPHHHNGDGKLSAREAAAVTRGRRRQQDSDDFCFVCAKREADKRHRLETFVYKMFKQMGISNLPNRTDSSFPKVPPIKSIIESVQMRGDVTRRMGDNGDEADGDEAAGGGDIQRIFLTAQKPPNGQFKDDSGICFFDLKPDLKNYRIRRADLWLFVPADRVEGDRDALTVHVFQASDRESDPRNHVVSRTITPGRFDDWIHVSIGAIVKHWLKTPASRYGLFIEVTESSGTTRSPCEAHAKPVLDVKTKRRGRFRTKRTLPARCSETERQELCCLYPMTVNFSDPVFAFVIEPRSFEANFCSGDCSLALAGEKVYSLAAKTMNASEDSPCCSATETSDMSILYWNLNSDIEYRTLKNMKVSQCGCR